MTPKHIRNERIDDSFFTAKTLVLSFTNLHNEGHLLLENYYKKEADEKDLIRFIERVIGGFWV